ncbi:Acylphosphatase [bioreactor metagenome]|uniref:Acylphosphatase n=1 Tax=bioreactor metagenome TaxID=1076179 RepID=A0A645A642_9ZZZZ
MSESNEINCVHAIVEGHVQGVGFRYFVKECADRFHLTGWVRNRYEGSVEVTAEGEKAKLDQFVALLHTGPSRSIVTDVKAEWSHSLGLYDQFSFLPTE